MAETNVAIDREKLEVTLTHVFDAPRDKVWKAYTSPRLVPQWWGPKGMSTTVDEMDVQPGGAWRYVQKDRQGNEYRFSGVYLVVSEPAYISDTFVYGTAGPGHELTETLELEELDGKTKAIATASYESVEDLEDMLRSGMESGAVETYQRLDQLLEEMKRGEG